MAALTGDHLINQNLLEKCGRKIQKCGENWRDMQRDEKVFSTKLRINLGIVGEIQVNEWVVWTDLILEGQGGIGKNIEGRLQKSLLIFFHTVQNWLHVFPASPRCLQEPAWDPIRPLKIFQRLSKRNDFPTV